MNLPPLAARDTPAGAVTLVGAGPGDPDLLTVRAVRALAQADVVYYDALVDREVLALAPTARWLYVGKRAQRHSIDQATIGRLLVRSARRGQRVVRLKCGDPFVFGRGGEEVEAVLAAGIPIAVVPGVSSAIAAPAAAGIPVSHRGVASGFAVLSGHAESAYASLASLAHAKLTVVMLMALGKRAAIADYAIAHGWSPTMPAAIVLGATTPRAWTWRGTLADLANTKLPADRAELPGLVVLGDVVAASAAWQLTSPIASPASEELHVVSR